MWRGRKPSIFTESGAKNGIFLVLGEVKKKKKREEEKRKKRGKKRKKRRRKKEEKRK